MPTGAPAYLQVFKHKDFYKYFFLFQDYLNTDSKKNIGAESDQTSDENDV